MPNDPKWRTIARASKQSISSVIAVYVHILVIASNATERGRTHGVCSEDIASALDLECEQVDQIIAAMQGRVLDGDVMSGWAKRQVDREDGAAERAKAWREAQKQKKTGKQNALQTQPNALQTQPNAPERIQTPEEIRLEEIRLDKEREEAENRASRLTLDFQFPESWGQWARTARADIQDPTAVFAKFVQVKADGDEKTPDGWFATFKAWLVNERPSISATAAPNQPITTPAKPGIDPTLAAILKESASGTVKPPSAEMRAKLAQLSGARACT